MFIRAVRPLRQAADGAIRLAVRSTAVRRDPDLAVDRFVEALRVSLPFRARLGFHGHRLGRRRRRT
jgi:hypothetical protein